MSTSRSCAVMCVALICCCGCEGLPSLATPAAPKLESAESAQRVRYATQQEGDALNWLLEHRVNTGMTVSEVEEVIGVAGERIYDDAAFKVSGGQYQSSDVCYKWGPDRTGKSVVLFFRDGRLVNFDPSEFGPG